MEPLWTEKYRPTRLQDLCLNPETAEALADWAASVAPDAGAAGAALYLHGPPGGGKTSVAGCLPGFQRIEKNMSDLRSPNQLSSLRNSFRHSRSVSNRPILLLLDEIDGIGCAQGYRLLAQWCADPKRAVRLVLTSNAYIPAIRAACRTVHMPALSPELLRDKLRWVASQEGACSEALLAAACRESGGDLRQAITRLQFAWTAPAPPPCSHVPDTHWLYSVALNSRLTPEQMRRFARATSLEELWRGVDRGLLPEVSQNILSHWALWKKARREPDSESMP